MSERVLLPARAKRRRSLSPSRNDDWIKRKRRMDLDDDRVMPLAFPTSSAAFLDHLSSHRGAHITSPFDKPPDDHENSDSENIMEDLAWEEYTDVGVEHRRLRKWERLQAPVEHVRPHSQPEPLKADFFSDLNTSRHIDETVQFMLDESQHAMSSSPIQHKPPSSSPFRERREDEWTEEERVREWGKEHATRNSLLHSLHVARLQSHDRSPIMTSPSPSESMSYQATTPHRPTPSRIPITTPFRNSQWTPGLLSSPFASSPIPSQSEDGDCTDRLRQLGFTHDQQHYQSLPQDIYEDTNRLLAQLNVQRIQRLEGSRY